MGLPRLAAAVFVAAALTAPAAWGQTEADELKKALTQAKDGGYKNDFNGKMIEKKLLDCGKDGKCEELPLKKKAKRKAGSAGLEEAPGGPDAAPAPAGDPADSDPAPTAAQAAGAPAEAAREAAGGRRERTMSRAAGTAETLRRSFRSAEDAPEAEGAGARTARPSARVAAGPAGPADPRTVPEMALAARTGFAATFRDHGLKVGAGPRGEPDIQHADGSPASGPELERLGAALRAEPAALLRRPDFFEVLPRERFAELKRDFSQRPELRPTVFKDIGMTERGRDFQWTASCSGLSGTCNSYVQESSYRKGRDVPPEDLARVWNAVHEEPAAEDDGGFDEYTEEDRRQAAAEDLAEERLRAGRRRAPTLASLLARMADAARGLGGSGEDSSARTVPASGPGAFPTAEARGASSPGDTAAGIAAAPRAARSSAPPPAPEGRRTAEGRNRLYALAAAAAAGLILLGLRLPGRR